VRTLALQHRDVAQFYDGMGGANGLGGESTRVGDRLLARRADETGLVGDNDKLAAVANVELAHDAADVRLRGRGTDDKASGDLVVTEAASNDIRSFTRR
jgi:hypothetical protein